MWNIICNRSTCQKMEIWDKCIHFLIKTLRILFTKFLGFKCSVIAVIHACTCLKEHTQTHIHVHAHMHAHGYGHGHACVCAHLHTHTHTSTHAHTHTHTCIRNVFMLTLCSNINFHVLIWGNWWYTVDTNIYLLFYYFVVLSLMFVQIKITWKCWSKIINEKTIFVCMLCYESSITVNSWFMMMIHAYLDCALHSYSSCKYIVTRLHVRYLMCLIRWKRYHLRRVRSNLI